MKFTTLFTLAFAAIASATAIAGSDSNLGAHEKRILGGKNPNWTEFLMKY